MKNNQRIAVFGASGAIGKAFIQQMSRKEQVNSIEAFSQRPVTFDCPHVHAHQMDYNDENAIKAAAVSIKKGEPLTQVIVATGILHTDNIQPEKSLKSLTKAAFYQVFYANTLFPALAAKHFLPLMDRKKPIVFAALSARVGSISDNKLGGWYSYRASKAALNMIIKNIAIEMRTKQPNAVIVGLHPGTVDSSLSEPFQKNIPREKLFTPDYAAEQLCLVIDQLTANDSGKCFDYHGLIIDP